MSSDPQFTQCGHTLLRALLQPNHGDFAGAAGQRAVEDAWNQIRTASGDRVPVSIRAYQSQAGPQIWIERPNDAPLDLAATLPAGNRQQVASMVVELFARAQVQLLGMVPGMTREELWTTIATLHQPTDPFAFALLSRNVFRVVSLALTRSITIARTIPHLVSEALDLLYIDMLAFDRLAGHLQIAPNDLMQVHVFYTIGRLSAPGEVQTLMACLDLVAGHLPPTSQQGLLRLMAAMVPVPLVRPTVAHCDQLLQTAGGPAAIERGGADANGIPLAGHWVAAAALRERLEPQTGWGSAGSGVHQNPNLYGQADNSGMFRIAAVGGYAAEQQAYGQGWQYTGRADASTAGWRIPRESGTWQSPSQEASGVYGMQYPSGGTPVPQPGSSPSQRALDERTDQWVESYEKMGRKLLDRARDVSDPARFVGTLKILSNVGAKYIADHRWSQALPIVRLVKAQSLRAAKWPPDLQAAVGAAMQLVLPPFELRAMVGDLTDADIRTQTALFELIAYYGHTAVPSLLELFLSRKLGAILKKEVVAAIKSSGPAAGPPILEAITSNGRNWGRVVPLIGLVGAVGYRAGERKVAEFLRHQQAAIRVEAVVSLYMMLEDKAQRYLVGALEDGDSSVVQRAVALLATGRSRDSNFKVFLHHMITTDGGQEGTDDQLVVSAVEALAVLGNVELAQGVDAEGAISEALRTSTRGGLRGLMSGGKGARSVGVQVAMVDALGAIGSTRAKAVLQTLGKDVAPEVRKSTEGALHRIEQRQVV